MRKYTGPARPVSLALHSPWERFERIVFLLAIIILACDLLWWRPN